MSGRVYMYMCVLGLSMWCLYQASKVSGRVYMYMCVLGLSMSPLSMFFMNG